MAGINGKPVLQPKAGLFVGDLAKSVLGQLGDAPIYGRQKRLDMATELVAKMITSSAQIDETFLRQQLASLRVNDVDLTEYCIPKIARTIGEDWVSDAWSFCDVSHAAARLFGLCKSFDAAWDNFIPPQDSRSVLLATIRPEGHLIGPTLLAQRLRRNGHSVLHLSNVGGRDVAHAMNNGSFHCVMLSVASEIGLDKCDFAIRNIRQSATQKIPIIVGGAALEFCGDLARKIGADLVTSDENSALKAIGAPSHAFHAGAAE